MENKSSSLSFIVLVTLGFVGLIIIQSTFFSKPKIPDAAVGGGAGNGAVAEMGGEEKKEAPAEGEEIPKRAERARKFVQIGSLTEEGGPLVVTFDSQGGTVRRIELNERKPNGQFKYLDVDYRKAWIGHLELEKTDAGAVVQLSGVGTPAYEAGIRVGDVLKSVNGEPITSAEDYALLMAETEPQVELELELLRDGAEKSVSVTTKPMPMQVIRQIDIDQMLPSQLGRRAFQLTLKKQMPGTSWPDVDKTMRTANWDVEAKDDSATLTFDVYADKDHPLQVVKTFRLSSDPERPYHIDMDVEIRNLGKTEIQTNFELCGPTGTTKEGWWYQMKTHGRTWAIGRMAGSRDITLSTDDRSYNFISGPEIISERMEATKESKPYGGTPLVMKGATTEERTLRKLTVDSLYFNVGLLPKREDFTVYSGYALTSQIPDENTNNKWGFKKSRKKGYTCDISYVLYSDPIMLAPYDAADPSTAYRESFEVFAGPKVPAILDKYDLDETRTFGWFAMFSKPLISLLHWLYWITGSFSYGLAIILLTVIVRSCLIPFSRKAALNAQMMQHLAPQMKELQEKHKEDPRKFMQARSELCAKYNYKPLSGCLVMFIQIPIFLGLYRGLSVDVALRDAPLVPGLGWCSNLGGPDQLFSWDTWMPGFLGSETGFLGPYFNLLPILAIALMVIQQKLFMPPATDEQSKMAQNMMKYMMLFMGFVFFKVPAGLCIYFVTSSLWAIIERKMLPKPELDVSKFEGGDSGPKKTTAGFLDRLKPPTEPAGPTPEERKRRDRERKKKLRDRK